MQETENKAVYLKKSQYMDTNVFENSLIPHRSEILTEAAERCLDIMYRLSQPSITLEELKAEGKAMTQEERDSARMYERHYLPEQVFKEIEEYVMDAYHIKSGFHDHMDLVRQYIAEGGMKSVYKDDGNGSMCRSYDTTPPLSEVIGKEAAEKAVELIDECKRFYRANGEENKFLFTVCCYGPCSNHKTVEEYWHNNGKPDFKTDDSVYEYKEDGEWITDEALNEE